jgi:hypothetical protein
MLFTKRTPPGKPCPTCYVRPGRSSSPITSVTVREGRSILTMMFNVIAVPTRASGNEIPHLSSHTSRVWRDDGCHAASMHTGDARFRTSLSGCSYPESVLRLELAYCRSAR